MLVFDNSPRLGSPDCKVDNPMGLRMDRNVRAVTAELTSVSACMEDHAHSRPMTKVGDPKSERIYRFTLVPYSRSFLHFAICTDHCKKFLQLISSTMQMYEFRGQYRYPTSPRCLRVILCKLPLPLNIRTSITCLASILHVP
jgi:hypothetical protein